MSNEKGLLASERLEDEPTTIPEAEDAPAVDNDDEIRQKVQAVIKKEDLEVKAKFEPIGILNHSTNANGKFTKAAVLDKDGVPKPIDSLNPDHNTSVQIFSPDDGDYLIEYNEGDDDYVVKSSQPHDSAGNVDEIVKPEFLEPTLAFINSGADTTFFIIDGHNSVINGLDMNQAFMRRTQLSKILEGVSSPTKDQLANWIDRSRIIDPATLSWDNAHRLDEGAVTLSINYVINDGVSTLSTQQAIAWSTIGGKEHGELLQIDINPGQYLSGSKNGNLNVNRVYDAPEEVDKVMVIHQSNDEVTSIEFFTRDGLPGKAMPWTHFDAAADYHDTLTDMFELDDVVENGQTLVNNVLFEFHEPFRVSLIENTKSLKYQETRVIIEKDIVEHFDINDEKSVKKMTHDVFSKPMVHIFKPDVSKHGVHALCFVNIPEEKLMTKEELKHGTSTE